MITENKSKYPIEDPEIAIERELARKRKTLTFEAEVARNEFAAWLLDTHKEIVDWTNPVTHWRFNAWIAEQGEREWLTEDQKILRVTRQNSAAKRRVSILKQNAEYEAQRKEAAAERKRRADAEYRRIRKEKKSYGVSV